jgi:hypothetical protein
MAMIVVAFFRAGMRLTVVQTGVFSVSIHWGGLSRVVFNRLVASSVIAGSKRHFSERDFILF